MECCTHPSCVPDADYEMEAKEGLARAAQQRSRGPAERVWNFESDVLLELAAES